MDNKIKKYFKYISVASVSIVILLIISAFIRIYPQISTDYNVNNDFFGFKVVSTSEHPLFLNVIHKNDDVSIGDTIYAIVEEDKLVKGVIVENTDNGIFIEDKGIRSIVKNGSIYTSILNTYLLLIIFILSILLILLL